MTFNESTLWYDDFCDISTPYHPECTPLMYIWQKRIKEIIALKPSYKNLCKLYIVIFNAYPFRFVGDDLRDKILATIQGILNGDFKNEFRYRYYYGPSKGTTSATGELFSFLAQALNYNK